MESQVDTTPKVGLFGSSALTNPNISLMLNTFAYTSDLPESVLKSKNISGHAREVKKGFNLESAELFMFSPVDPYFNLYTTIPFTESGIELEEIYFVTTAIPAGFQIKGGKFRSGFGRLNAQHTHAWDFVDPPLPYKAFLGTDGLIEKGVQLTYIPGLPLYTLLGVELLQGENKILFGPDAESGPHAFVSYIKVSSDIGDNSTLLFGPSAAGGRTKTDSGFKGDSNLYGLELTYKWKPSKREGFIFQSEYLYRVQEGNLEDKTASTFQDSLYLQILYQFERWKFGLRYDRLGISKDEYKEIERDFDKNSWRTSGSLEFNPTEFSRIRFQYTHDRSVKDGRINNEFLLQFIMGIGAHAAHPF